MAFQDRSRMLFTPTANVVKLNPMWGKGGPLYLWAERGMIHWEYSETNGFGSMKIRDALKRVLALSQMIIKSSESKSWAYEKYEMQRFIVKMEHVIRQAREQGCPDDPASSREADRRRKSMSVAPRRTDGIISGGLTPGRDFRPGPPPMPTLPR